MDLKHLHTFLTLCKLQNFTKTAAHLHYAQSNVTAQIQQLEKELNVRLFDRLGKRVSLTPSGKELIPYAQKLLHLSEDIKIRFSGKNSGRITIGASESVCIYKLPKIIKDFQTAHPEIELYLQVLDGSDFTALLADNTIDIAITLDTPVKSPSTETVLQIDETIGVFSTPEHTLAQKQLVSLHDIAEHRLLLTSKDCCYRKMFEADLSEASLQPQIALETSSLQVIKQAALSGLGVCVLPRLAVQKELDRRELIQINYVTNYKIVYQVYYHKDKWLSPDLNEFISIVKGRIQDENAQ